MTSAPIKHHIPHVGLVTQRATTRGSRAGGTTGSARQRAAASRAAAKVNDGALFPIQVAPLKYLI